MVFYSFQIFPFLPPVTPVYVRLTDVVLKFAEDVSSSYFPTCASVLIFYWTLSLLTHLFFGNVKTIKPI